jgi:nucleotide-binding universal stress UspA family protein
VFKKILVPIDNSPIAEQALPTAIGLARRSGTPLELVYVHRTEPAGGYSDAPWNAGRRSSQQSYLDGVADEVRRASGVTVHTSFSSGDPIPAICAQAHRLGADLIVMTSHGRTGISRAWLGSVADGVVRESCVPVLLLHPQPLNREPAPRAFKRVLVPLDGSADAEMVLDAACTLAGNDGARVILLEIVAPIPLMVVDTTIGYAAPLTIPDVEATQEVVELAKQRLETTARRVTAEGHDVEQHVVASGFAGQAILAAAREHMADAIAMTTTGRGASRLIIGSVADAVLRGTSLPLLLYRPRASGAIRGSSEESSLARA